jgi:hypothetical protein
MKEMLSGVGLNELLGATLAEFDILQIKLFGVYNLNVNTFVHKLCA